MATLLDYAGKVREDVFLMLFSLKQYIKFLINKLLCLTKVLPRCDSNVVIGGWMGNRFSDNSKAMYLFLYEHKKMLNIKNICYITKNKKIYDYLNKQGYPCQMYRSLKGIWAQLRAKYHIVDQGGGVDLNKYCSMGAVKVNLWHGFPLKKIGYHVTYPNLSLNEIIEKTNAKIELSGWNKFYNIVLSEKQMELQQYAFGLEDKLMLKGVYPRTLYMLDKMSPFVLDVDHPILEMIHNIKNTNKQIIAYFPTFRDNQKQNFQCVKCIQYLDQFASDHDSVILTKLHLASGLDLTFEENENVINLDSMSDLYDYLKYVDILITDYSSISFDYILFQRPIVYYAFDLEYYQASDRGFLFEYETMCAGDIVKSLNELGKSLDSVMANQNDYLRRYQAKTERIINIVYDHKIPDLDDLFTLWNEINCL